MSNPAAIVRMANQIAGFFASHGDVQAIASTQDHIRKFWDPRMRAQLKSHLEAGGEGLSVIARRAAAGLAKPEHAGTY